MDELRSVYKSELRILPGEIPRIKGIIPYGSLSHDLGGFREILRRPFGETLRGNDKVVALWSHDAAKPLASTSNDTLKLRDSEDGLEVEMALDLQVSWQNDAYRSVKSGNLTGLSFGFLIPPGGDSWTETATGTIREIFSAKLTEISPVSFPAYPESQVQARQVKNPHDERQKRRQEMDELRAYWENTPTAKRGAHKQDNRQEFSCTREFLQAVMETGDMKGKTLDPRLQRAATGLGESPASDGGFLLPSNLIDSLLFGDDASSLLNLCDKYTITQGLSASFPSTDEATRVSGSELGGLTCTWGNEGGSLSYVNPTLDALQLSLKKLKCYIPVSDEIFESGPLAERYLKNVGRRSLAYAIDSSIYKGTGAGMPLGVLHAPCTITIDPEPGQSASTISAMNCRKLVAHLPPESLGRDSLCFLINPELFEIALTVSSGVGGGGAPLISYDPQGLPRIMGIRCIPWQHASAPGTRGDILVGDFSQYVWLDRKIRQAVSIHVLFDTDEEVFRLVYRCDGQPSWSRSVSPANASSASRKMSPFVVLGPRS